MKKVVVFGGRDLWLSVYALDIWLGIFGLTPNQFELVEGEAPGVDVSARNWAEFHGMEPKKFFANWTLYKKGGGPIRNAQMAEYADFGVGFITDGSVGTANMHKQLIKRDKIAHMVRYDFIEDLYDGSQEDL